MSKSLAKKEYVDKLSTNTFTVSSLEEIIEVCKKNKNRTLHFWNSEAFTIDEIWVPSWVNILIFSANQNNLVGIAVASSNPNVAFLLCYANSKWKCREL